MFVWGQARGDVRSGTASAGSCGIRLVCVCAECMWVCAVWLVMFCRHCRQFLLVLHGFWARLSSYQVSPPSGFPFISPLPVTFQCSVHSSVPVPTLAQPPSSDLFPVNPPPPPSFPPLKSYRPLLSLLIFF